MQSKHETDPKQLLGHPAEPHKRRGGNDPLPPAARIEPSILSRFTTPPGLALARVDRTNMGITDVCRMALGSQGPNLRITEVCRVVPASRAMGCPWRGERGREATRIAGRLASAANRTAPVSIASAARAAWGVPVHRERLPQRQNVVEFRTGRARA